MPSSDSPISLTVVSESMVFPDQTSTLGDLKLSVSDLPMLSCHYIQKGGLFTKPSFPIQSLVSLLKSGLSQTLSRFPPLAGRLITDKTGYLYITCNDAGVDFIHAAATDVSVCDILSPTRVPESVKEFFAFDRTVSYTGHRNPILAVQLTELKDSVFIGCAVNHAVTDGTSFWNFFNTFAEVCCGRNSFSRKPDFSRESILISQAVLQLPEGGPKVTFNANEPLAERIFSFSREAILKLKARTNNKKWTHQNDDVAAAVEILGNNGDRVTAIIENWLSNNNNNSNLQITEKITAEAAGAEISSFQSLCALLWKAVTKARNLPDTKTTTFRMAVNCRHRLEPKLDPYYFGNAIQSIPTYASAGDVSSRDLRWCAEQLNEKVKAHGSDSVRECVQDWEKNPRVFPLGNFDGASMTMGSSPRFPMYDCDFGWGRPLAVRSGRANKFDGKISAFPGRDGAGTVDLEVVLAPDTMVGLEADLEFMQYVSNKEVAVIHCNSGEELSETKVC